MQLVTYATLYLAQFVFARNVNYEDTVTISSLEVLATTQPMKTSKSLSRYEQGLEDYDEAVARGIMDYNYDDHHDDDHHHKEEEEMKPIEQMKAVKTDPWAGYYDFVINEGSFKFWAVFQLGTALLLAYSAFAAIYYAKFNPMTSDYDYYDDFFFRSNGRSAASKTSSSWLGLDSQTFQRIISAITSKKYS